MTSNSKTTLNDAIAAMEDAYSRLSAAADLALHERAQFAQNREAAQAEITSSWAAHTGELEKQIAQMETQITQLVAENDFLKSDNLRLSNQLQQLQSDYLDLQSTAGDVVGRLDTTVRQLDLILEH